ncbi:MAG: LacI family transcriptional regulator [Balneolales bacterium]|nr:LacI family transcriptional regulator [Balneolales bacterium]
MKVRLTDVANKAGFSVSTISRALRGEGRISEENRKKIFATAHELGYPLPSGNREFPDDFPTYIALIFQFRSGEFYSSLFDGFEKAAENKAVKIGLFSINEQLDTVPSVIEQVRLMGFKAAVLFAPGLSEQHYQYILHTTQQDFPIISCSNINETVLDTVTFDAYQGATLVAKHFHNQGFKKLGIIEGPIEMPESRFRTNGFLDYLTHIGEGTLCWRFRGDYSTDSGISAFEDFLSTNEKPEAIFSANDAMAVGFIEAAKRNGIEIPDDVAISGYDNLPICESHFPSITSVDTNYIRLAENAIDYLLTKLEKPSVHQGIVSMVPVSLKVRGSTQNMKK